MKVLIVLCVIAGVCSDEPHDEQHEVVTVAEIVEKINGENEECAIEHKIDLKVMFREMKTIENFVPTDSMKCFAACLLKKNGFMNPNGSLTRKYNDSAGAEKCRNLTGWDECGAAYKIMLCLNKYGFLHTGED